MGIQSLLNSCPLSHSLLLILDSITPAPVHYVDSHPVYGKVWIQNTHCAKNWIYAIGYFAYISSLRIKNPTCGMNQFRTVFISSILNRITCA